MVLSVENTNRNSSLHGRESRTQSMRAPPSENTSANVVSATGVGGCRSRTCSRGHTPRGCVRWHACARGCSIGDILTRPILFLIAFSVVSDLVSFSAELGGGKTSVTSNVLFPPGAAAQNFTCPANAGAIKSWPGKVGEGVPIMACQCKAGYFASSMEFFRLMLIRELAIQIDDCTAVYQCPRTFNP